jgi:endonuclease YncB( thermonuclease family)
MNRTTALLGGIALFGTVAALAIADPAPLEGTARVIDGDTLEINGQRIRLWGIDAFESAQRCEDGLTQSGTYGCGTAAWGAMIRLTQDKIVRCKQKDTDRYKRVVAQCFVDNTDLGHALVLQGWAFDYAQYSGGAYRDVQEGAHEAKSGAWAGTFQWPWDYRHSRVK